MEYFKLLCLCWIVAAPLELSAAQIKLEGSYRSGSEMGEDVDIDGDFAVVSVPGTRAADVNSGLVSAFQKIDGEWMKMQSIFPSDGFEGDRFGRRLSLDGRRLAVSAPSDNSVIGDDYFEDLGSVFIYELDEEDVWQPVAKILPSDLASNTFFGYNLSLDGDSLIVAAVGGAGAVYVYDLIDGQWLEIAKITDSSSPGVTRFGFFDVILEDDFAFIASSIDSGDNTTGQVNVYQKTDGIWLKQAKITSADNLNNDFFAWSLGYHDGRLVVGADTVANNQGAVYIYELEGSSWVKKSKIDLPSNGNDRFFGYSVALSVDQLFVGALHDNDSGILGAVHVFNYTNSEWVYAEKIAAEGTEDTFLFHNDFGSSINVDYDQIIIGADFSGVGSGAAYISDVEPNGVTFSVNQGLNGNWFNPETPGQGIFFDVKPEFDYAYMGWFTYDTQLAMDDEAGQIGAAGQRWLVGNGSINQSTSSITFDMFYAAGGLFDDAQAVTLPDADPYGSMTAVFNDDCATATVSYEIPSQNLSGVYSITRPSAGSLGLCAAFAQGDVEVPANTFDVSLNGHWYNPETQGQGIFVEQFAGTTQAFMGWFTYDSELVSNPVMSQVGEDGQRWLVGSGAVNADDSNILDYDLLYSAGGLFDDPTAVTVEGAGSNATLSIEFINCGNAQVNYDIPAENISGSYAMVKLLTDTNQTCPAGVQ